MKEISHLKIKLTHYFNLLKVVILLDNKLKLQLIHLQINIVYLILVRKY